MVKFTLNITVSCDDHDLEILDVLNKPAGKNFWLDEIETNTYYGLLAAGVRNPEAKAEIVEVQNA